MESDSGNLERFVAAQEPVFGEVIAELRRGRKTSHWMWFVFPQIRGLGRSSMAVRYGLQSRDEASRYWQHEVLGPRLWECIDLLLHVDNSKTAHDIFGSPDDLKLRSCLTLFHAAVPSEEIFQIALKRFFDGVADERTLKLLATEHR